MQAVLPRNDMLSIRNFLRWAGVGTQPSKDYTDSVRQLIKPIDAAALTSVRRVVDEADRGVLASQDVCQQAQLELENLFNSAQDSDSESGEVNRG